MTTMTLPGDISMLRRARDAGATVPPGSDGAEAAGAAGPLVRARTLGRTSPGNPLVRAMALVGARHRGETRANAIAADYAERRNKAKVRIDIAPDGTQTMTAKDVPIGDPVAESEEAYVASFEEAAEALGEVDRKRFQRLRAGLDPDRIRKQLSTRDGAIKAAYELGAKNDSEANYAADRLLSGKASIDRAIEKLRERRAEDVREIMAAVQGQSEQRDRAAKAQRRTIVSEIEKSDLDSVNIPSIAARAGVDGEDIEDDPQALAELKRRRERLTLHKAKSDFQTRESERKEIEKERRDLERELRAEAAEARAEAREARAINAEVRSAVTAERMARAEDRAISREERIRQDAAADRHRSKITRVVSDIEETYEKMQTNSREFAKLDPEADADARAELQRQNRELRSAQIKQRETLDSLLGKQSTARAPSAARTAQHQEARSRSINSADDTVIVETESGANILLPLVAADGRRITPAESLAEYQRSGKSLGSFKTGDEAAGYAQRKYGAPPAQYPPDVEQRIAAAVAAGFKREQAIQRLKDAGVIKLPGRRSTATAEASARTTETITQEEYDALIDAGETPASIAADGLVVAPRNAATRVGTRKTFPNGRVGEWDGKGWVMVQSGVETFSPRIEAGIDAYMQP